jgi:hypothetical protein
MGLFEYAEITASRRKYTSAGMYHTNPITTLLEEAESIYGGEQRLSCLMSLGAGTASTASMPADLSWLDVHGLLQAMETQQQKTTIDTQRQFGHLEAYFRFSVDRGIGSACLHDWTSSQSDKIEGHVQEYLDWSQQSNALEAAVGCLVDRKGVITLDRSSKDTLALILPFPASTPDCFIDHAAGAAVMAKPIPPVTQFFVLRRKAWNFMEQNLVNAPNDKLTIFLITGLGGSGKSTLFSYYVQTYGSKCV